MKKLIWPVLLLTLTVSLAFLQRVARSDSGAMAEDSLSDRVAMLERREKILEELVTPQSINWLIKNHLAELAGPDKKVQQELLDAVNESEGTEQSADAGKRSSNTYAHECRIIEANLRASGHEACVKRCKAECDACTQAANGNPDAESKCRSNYVLCCLACPK